MEEYIMTPIKNPQLLVALLSSVLFMSSATALVDTPLPFMVPHGYYSLDQDHLQEKTQEYENLFTKSGTRVLSRRAQ